jgi:hypothetical protein
MHLNFSVFKFCLKNHTFTHKQISKTPPKPGEITKLCYSGRFLLYTFYNSVDIKVTPGQVEKLKGIQVQKYLFRIFSLKN